MEREDNRTASKLADTAACGGANTLLGTTARQITVRERINEVIDDHNRAVAKLMRLRDSTPRQILDMPQSSIAALAYPDHSPF